MKKNAFQKYLNEHKDRIFSYNYYLLKNREDAEDVTQEVFIRLWNNREKVDKKSMRAWMVRVAHNRCIDLIRQKKAVAGREKISASVEPETLKSEDDSYSNPTLKYELSETHKSLTAAMETLPEKTRSVLLMHYFQDLKYESISKILNTSISSVKVTVHRGKKMLRLALADDYPERVRSQRDEVSVP